MVHHARDLGNAWHPIPSADDASCTDEEGSLATFPSVGKRVNIA